MTNRRRVPLLFLLSMLLLPVSGLALNSHTVRPQQVPTEDDNFLDLGYRRAPLTRLPDFGTQASQFGRASFRPWNASYWPTHKGMLAARYADKGYPDSKNWDVNYSYYLANPSSYYVAVGRSNELSPAEKYDLLLEDDEWTLTRHMWNKGLDVKAMYGRVPTWFGICHGWSAVTHMRVPEPGEPVTVTSVNGRHSIKFYPRDVKALLSYLWAESSPKSLFIGKRCKKGKPERDSSGRILDPECLDNNPMTWHLAVLNRVGRDGDSVVMDSSMDGEVWNYAVDSYFFRYFNPRTLRPTKSWKEAVVPRAKFLGDPYKAHRDTRTTSIVGVVMDVYFPAATEPKISSRGGGTIIYKQKKFVYDLELDDNLNIIGGEWHSSDRPDFLWTFPYEAKAATTNDLNLTTAWVNYTSLPAEWADAAKRASKYGKVLASIANELLARSLGAPQEVPEVEEPHEPEPMPGNSLSRLPFN
jgi:hypothetical protein